MPRFDLTQFNTYGLDYKIFNDVLYVKPQWTASGKRSKQWSNVKTKRGQRVLNYATMGDVSLLYEDVVLPDRVLMEISYFEIFDGDRTGEVLRQLIRPSAGQKLVLNIRIGGEYRRFNVAKIITENTKKGEFFKMAYTLREIMNSEYHDGGDILIQVVELPQENPELKGIKQGNFNCVILPVILLLQKQKQSKANQSRIDKLLKYHKEVKDAGLDNEGIHRVSKMARINIAIYDHCGKVWHKFVTAKDRKTLLLDVHNNHAEVRNDPTLLQQVYNAQRGESPCGLRPPCPAGAITPNVQKKRSYKLVLAEPVDLKLFKEQEVKWVSQDELETLIPQHLDGHIIQSKGNPKALITTAIIYKTRFDEHEQYPKAFTDGGVGKAKFLEQNPHMAKPNIHPILWEADRSGFYMRTGKSHHRNIKFDMNHAYKSFKNSGCFKGFPEQINSVLTFENTTASQARGINNASIFHHNGLLYIDYPKLDIEILKTKTEGKYPRIYYECSGWYPIEIVEEIYKLYGIDPIVKAIAIGDDTFDIDVTKFTNPQFRAFVGKTTSKYVSDTWRTTDKNEYLRALYQLQDNVIGVYEDRVETGEVQGIKKISTVRSYSIEHTVPDKTPWQCPVVAVYVKAHQKLQLFKQYNKLVDNGILPRYISVDGIEISGNQKKKAIPLFDTSRTDWHNFDFLDKYVLPKLTAGFTKGIEISSAIEDESCGRRLCCRVDGTKSLATASSVPQARIKTDPNPIELTEDEEDEYNNSICMFNGKEMTNKERDILVLGDAYIDMNTSKWKQEEIKPASSHYIDVIERKVPDPPIAPLYSTYTHLPRLLHLAGSGGNGKTEFVVKLALQYENICYTATTHNACSELEMRGKTLLDRPIIANTYHRIFGIGCHTKTIPNASVYVIEEASMLSDEHLGLIDARLREQFNPDKSFGGKRIILVGDFWQLPVLKPMTSLYDPWTNTKTPLYSQFTVQELTENWRQKKDPEFYDLCQLLRKKLTKDEALEIIDKLNDRCVSDAPDAKTINDMYMAGVNMQCDDMNKLQYGGKFDVGTKVINSKTFKYGKTKIPNGRIGVVVAHGHTSSTTGIKRGSPLYIQFEGFSEVCEFKGKRDEFKPAYAVTVHKAQGRTLKGKVVINPSRLFDKNHLYVALTRASNFNSIYLTEPISLRVFAKTCFVIGITDKANTTPSWRLASMVKRYKAEEPRLTVDFLQGMRQAQNNTCCYCKIHMADKFGFDNSITLERINDEKKHVLTNIKLACFKCNSSHQGQKPRCHSILKNDCSAAS